jgi:hypothetical protein
MFKSLLVVVVTLGLSVYGQQTPRSKSQAAGAVGKTHAAANVSKGQIVQPAIEQGKLADAYSLLISFHGCGDLLLTDPRGHKLGYDATGKKSYLQVAGGIYDEGDLIDEDEDEANQQEQEKAAGKQPDCMADKTVQFPNPVHGAYTLTIFVSRAAGFNLEVTSYGADAKANAHYLTSQKAGSAPRLFYQFEMPPRSGTNFQVKSASK